jgi:dephospho-CoA kinase
MSTLLRVALTGGIASGKSTIATKFKELGAPIIDSDVISRDIVEPGKPCFKAILNEFGANLLTDEGSIDREKLRNIIFDNKEAKNMLEDILHPAIYQEIENKVSQVTYPYCLIVIPLLIETQAMDRFDRILVVDTTENSQIKRAKNRDKSSIKILEKIINNQAKREQRLKYADDIIDNNVKIEDLNEAVLNLHEKYLKLTSINHKMI